MRGPDAIADLIQQSGAGRVAWFVFCRCRHKIPSDQNNQGDTLPLNMSCGVGAVDLR